VVEKGRYVAPLDAGFCAQMRPETLQQYGFPEGAAWVAASPH
jgi:hypothetical protein